MFEALGPYRILEWVGRDGLGEVLRARDTRHGRTVTLKVPGDHVADDPSARQAFVDAATAAIAISHPNIAAVYDVEEQDGRLYLATEFVPGQTVRALVGGRGINPRRAIDLAIQIADALADAHARQVVHGDLRADTIVVTARGNAKILDFGLAPWIRADAAGGGPRGVRGQAGDSSHDIAGLGAVLFEMLTGVAPPDASAPPAPTSITRRLPPEVDAIVARALSRTANERYEAAATMAGELRALAAILDTRAAAAEPVPVGRPARRHRYGRWIALGAGVAAAAAAAFFWMR